jgi:hypothetical protein
MTIPPSPDFEADCEVGALSFACVAETLEAIDNARNLEGLPDMALPSNWSDLTSPQQLFVATNLERTVRSLPPLSSMVGALDEAAAQGAATALEPVLPPNFPASRWGSNWARGYGNPLEALYFWMYDDGPGSSNVDCTPSAVQRCWDHRRNILGTLTCAPCVLGAAEGIDINGQVDVTELLADAPSALSGDFTWSQESPFIPAW